MTFMHKLSCRLALIRDSLSVITAAAAILSCEVPAVNGSAPAQQVVKIIVVPESLSLDPTQQIKFAAYGRSVSGDCGCVVVLGKERLLTGIESFAASAIQTT